MSRHNQLSDALQKICEKVKFPYAVAVAIGPGDAALISQGIKAANVDFIDLMNVIIDAGKKQRYFARYSCEQVYCSMCCMFYIMESY